MICRYETMNALVKYRYGVKQHERGQITQECLSQLLQNLDQLKICWFDHSIDYQQVRTALELNSQKMIRFNSRVCLFVQGIPLRITQPQYQVRKPSFNKKKEVWKGEEQSLVSWTFFLGACNPAPDRLNDLKFYIQGAFVGYYWVLVKSRSCDLYRG